MTNGGTLSLAVMLTFGLTLTSVDVICTVAYWAGRAVEWTRFRMRYWSPLVTDAPEIYRLLALIVLSRLRTRYWNARAGLNRWWGRRRVATAAVNEGGRA